MTESPGLRGLFHVAPGERASVDHVHDCYNEILRRPPDEAGLAYYVQIVENGLSKVRLVKAFLNSDEFRATADTAHRERVEGLYRELADQVELSRDDISWFHSMPMPDGEVMKGERPIDVLRREADCIFRHGVAGRSLLDIGAWDGFFSFEAERRGARDILSTDHFCWSGPGWGTKEGYDYTHRAWNSKARSLDIDVFSLDPRDLGTFDIVLFSGVLYHLKDPYGGLERAANMTHDLLIVETVTYCNRLDEPVLRHFPGTDLDGDPTNFFAPNTAALESLLTEIGFARVEIVRNPGLPSDAPPGTVRNHDRHIAHAWRE